MDVNRGYKGTSLITRVSKGCFGYITEGVSKVHLFLYDKSYMIDRLIVLPFVYHLCLFWDNIFAPTRHRAIPCVPNIDIYI